MAMDRVSGLGFAPPDQRNHRHRSDFKFGANGPLAEP